MSGGSEPKGWEGTGIRAHSEEQEGLEGHKRRRTNRSKGEFLDGSGFEEGKLWTTDYMLTLQRPFQHALRSVYVLLCCCAVIPLITPGERAQAEPGKFPAVTACVISGTLE